MASNSIIGTPLSELIENGVLLENMQRIAANGKSTYTQMIEILKLLNVVYSPERDFELTSTLKVNVGAIGIVVIKSGKVLITYKVDAVYKGIVFKLTDVDYTVSSEDKEESSTIRCRAFYTDDDAEELEDDPDYGIGAYAYCRGNIYKMNEEYHWEVITDNIDDHYILVAFEGIYFYDNGEISLVTKDFDDSSITSTLEMLNNNRLSDEEDIMNLQQAVRDIQEHGAPTQCDSTLNPNSDNPVKNSTLTRQFRELEENKQDYLVSGTNIKSVNGESLLGEGNIEIKSSATVLVVSYAGDDPQQKEGAWLKDQIYYDTSNGVFYKCDRNNEVPSSPITVPDGTILYIETPYNAFYYYNNQIDGEPIPFKESIDDEIKENSHHPVENAAIYYALLDKQDSLNAKNGIIIRPKEETENVPAKYIIELDSNQLDSIVENLQAITVMKQKVDAMWEELHPSPEPEPQLRIFDPLVGNWGSIHIDKDPEDITVEDVMDEDYDVPLLEDLEEDEVQIWDSGDTAPEGKYFITGTKAGFIPGSSLSKANAYYNRKLLRALMSDEGDYADCIGVVLGSEGTAECYCINGIPGDGTNSQGYATDDEGLTNSDRWNRGIVCKKDFTIKGLTTDNDGNPTSGFRQTHQSGPMIATTHSLNVLGAYMEAYYQGPGLIYIDSVNGIDQIQIKDSYFTTSTNYKYTTKFIIFAARDEYPIDAYSVLKETNAIKDLLIYNNTFIGAFAIYNQGSDSTFSVITCNRFLDSCRIVNNKFPLCPYYAFDIAVPNTGSDGGGPNGTVRAFTQCPIYIVGNEITGLGELVNVTSGTQYVSMMLEMSRTYVLHNTFKNKVVKQPGASSTSIGGYISSTNLYFCNNTCEDFARFSTSRLNNAVIMFKGMQIPSTYSDNHYPTSRYIVNNVFKQNISRIKSWWDAFLATSAATQADRDLDFDICLSTSILSTTLDFAEETVLSGNTFNIRGIRGISDSDPHKSNKITIENNTINFGKFYPDTAKSCIFTVRTKELSIKNNRLVENVNPTPFVKISTTTAYPDPGANKTTITGNDYLSGVVLQKIVGSAGIGTPTTIANTGGSVIPVSEITTEEQTILDGDTTPVS